MGNEMAHYACDCWDAECLTSYGWVECVGCADRSAYDLTQHFKATGVRLSAEKHLPEPQTREIVEPVLNKGIIGKEFKKDAKTICDALAALDLNSVSAVEESLNTNGKYELLVDDKEFVLTKDMISIKKSTKTFHVEEIIPSVIEPSFGIGRIMYALFEHNFKMRDGDEQRTYLALPPLVAPLKASILPLSSNPEFQPFIKMLSSELSQNGISFKVDDSGGSIGKRYARTDEIAIPFGITIDFDTLKEPHSVTLRERDSMTQVRVKVNEVASVIKDLSLAKITWEDVQSKYPKFEAQEGSK